MHDEWPIGRSIPDIRIDTPDQEHLWQIAQAQLVAKPPKDHECDDVGWILSAIENSTAALGLLQNWGCQCVPDIFAPVLGPGVGRGMDFEVGGSPGRGSLGGHHGDQQS